MTNFKIVTDSTSDLPESYIEEHKLGFLHLSCMFEGVTYGDENKLNLSDFYEAVRNGSTPTTSQVNPEKAKEGLLKVISECKKVLVIAFSSALSGTFQSIRLAAEEIMEDDSEADIRVIDSLSASLGEGLMVHKAVTMCEEGATLDETYNWIEEHKLNFCHLFTVDDLNYLQRGGRINKATALVGTMIGIKPLLHVDNEGSLVSVDKCRGRKKSLTKLVDMMEENIGSYRDKESKVFISHGDSIDDAKFVAEEVKNRFGYETEIINFIGPVIGSHSGPGTIALFFMGDKR